MSLTLFWNWNLTIWLQDFDGNILNADTPINFINKETWEIERISWHFVDQNPEIFYSENSKYKLPWYSYAEFRDFFSNDWHRGFDGLFEDVKNAILNNDFASSFENFKNIFLINARFFAIITARWNSPDNFARVFTYLNEKTLTEEEKEIQFKNILKNFNLLENTSREEALYHYFWKVVNYIACHNPQIEKIMWFEDLSPSDRKAKATEFVIDYYIKFYEKLNWKNIKELLDWKSVSVGFNDDSLGNCLDIFKIMKKLKYSENFYPEISKKFSVFYTWNPEKFDEILEKLWDKKYFESKIISDWKILKIKVK